VAGIVDVAQALADVVVDEGTVLLRAAFVETPREAAEIKLPPRRPSTAIAGGDAR
jgi:hypothetical protein